MFSLAWEWGCVEEKGDFPHDRSTDSPPRRRFRNTQQAGYLAFLKLSLSQRVFLLHFSHSPLFTLLTPLHVAGLKGQTRSHSASGMAEASLQGLSVSSCPVGKAAAASTPMGCSPRQPQYLSRAFARDCPCLAGGWQQQFEPVKWAGWGFSLFPAF